MTSNLPRPMAPHKGPSFKIERYFAPYEFIAKYHLCCSDCEPLSLQELLELADSECRTLYSSLVLSYTESSGHPLLRKQICESYFTTLSPENVLVCCPEEGIFIAMQALLSPGDHVICMMPGYQSLYELARSNGCEVSFWTGEESVINEEEGVARWEFKLEELEKLIRPSTRLLIVNFPHNPTGYLPTPQMLLQVVDLSRRRNLFVFSDEMYRFLEAPGRQRLPSLADLYEHAVSLSGVSKSLSLPGLRIGWLGTKNVKVLAELQARKDWTTICPPAPSEILALIALRSIETITERNNKVIERNTALLVELQRRHPDVLNVLRGAGGSTLFVRIYPQPLQHANVFDFAKGLMAEKSTLALPSIVFEEEMANTDEGAEIKSAEGVGVQAEKWSHMRFGLGRENFPAALEQLESYIVQRKTMH